MGEGHRSDGRDIEVRLLDAERDGLEQQHGADAGKKIRPQDPWVRLFGSRQGQHREPIVTGHCLKALDTALLDRQMNCLAHLGHLGGGAMNDRERVELVESERFVDPLGDVA